MSERWTVRPKHAPGGPTSWRVHDEQDSGRPVAEFPDEDAARSHAARLAEGPFDWDEQEAWQDPDEEDDWSHDAAPIGTAGEDGPRAELRSAAPDKPASVPSLHHRPEGPP